MKKQRVKNPLPKIDGEPKNGTYLTLNSRIDPQTLITKEETKKIFLTRYGYEPKEVFFGKPNGSLIYAGPVEGKPICNDYPAPATKPMPIPQQELLFGDDI